MPRPNPKFHYSIHRDRRLKRLRKLLERLPTKQEWLEVSWVLDRARMDASFKPPATFNFPDEFLFAKMDKPGAIYGWELESLLTECLATELKPGRRSLNVKNWSAVAALVTALRATGNAESGLRDPEEILVDVGRILTKQLPWQMHGHNVADYVRWWSIFGESEKLQEVFERNVGIRFAKFVQIGFALNQAFNENCYNRYPAGLGELGISTDDVAAFVKATCMDIREASVGAEGIVAVSAEIDFRRSHLRPKPIIRVGAPPSEKFTRPIEQLLIWRITSGLYYDVISNGSVANEIGDQYENYTRELLRSVLSARRVSGNDRYGSSKNERKTPDCIVRKDCTVELSIECKAKKQSLSVQLSTMETSERQTAINELARGVVQLCRFERDVALGIVPDHIMSTHPVFLLTTLDDWMFTGPNVRGAIFKRARKIAADAGETFERIEESTVAICTATELDDILSCYTYEDFLEICRSAFDAKLKDYSLVSIARAEFSSRRTSRSYPLAGKLDELLGVDLDARQLR